MVAIRAAQRVFLGRGEKGSPQKKGASPQVGIFKRGKSPIFFGPKREKKGVFL